MKIVDKIYRKIAYYESLCYSKLHSKKLIKEIEQSKGSKCIYFFCTPIHSNLGDQAQLMCWLKLFNEWYAGYHVILIPSAFRQFKTMSKIREVIDKNDLIFIHSGYLIFDPHPELPLILDVIRYFYDYPITILPQTVNLINDWCKQVVSNSFNAHANLTLMCRDEVSLRNAKDLFPNVNVKLMPDVVTSLIGDESLAFDCKSRNGILFCLRNDGEKYYSDEELFVLMRRFQNIKIAKSDTSIHASAWKWDSKREYMIYSILKRFATYQLVITDRYHGTIFSQIVNTPVIVLSSSDHKLSSGVKWFPKAIFGQNIFYAQNLEVAYDIAVEILKRNGHTIVNPSWFKDNYYKSID